jgi:gamma-glutamylcyclotransferase (GGCT)/AIG2-like uncharacterized protein YtfP
MIEPTAFFVYGTLKQNQLRGAMWPRKPLSVVPGIVRARLFDIGPYPAALQGEAWLLGEIWQFQQVDLSETKKVLDQIEGFRPGASNNEYLRHVVNAHCFTAEDSDSQVSCWMYFAPDEYRLVGKREIVPFCNLSDVFPTVRQDWGNEKVAFWPDPKARIPRSFFEE